MKVPDATTDSIGKIALKYRAPNKTRIYLNKYIYTEITNLAVNYLN